MTNMHQDQAHIDATLVARLLGSQYPRWADLPVRPVASGGTVNAIYRVGAEPAVRLPLTADGVGALVAEARWLPVLAPLLPLAVPSVEAVGEPAEGYPWPWAVHLWIEGEVLREGHVPAPERIARDLGAFVVALRGADVGPDAPPAHRGAPPATQDAETRAAVEQLRATDEPFDARAALAVWEESLAAPPWAGPPCWTHSDLMPTNLLAGDGRLVAVLDFGTAGVGDPAADLIPAWNLLPPGARRSFRDHVDVDDATWARGRGWALSMALVQLPYYRRTNPVISANARHVLAQVLAG